MATVDLTVARARDVAGIRRRVIGKYTGPTLYAAGGEALTAQDVGLGTIEFLIFELASDGSTVRTLLYDYTNAKVKWFTTASAEAGAVDFSTFSARFEAVGM